MFYKDVVSLSSVKFKRLTGVKREVFDLMLEEIERSKSATRKHPTRRISPKLSLADKLLMYYREYWTLFHIGTTYGISESRTCEIIRELEGILIRDPHFHRGFDAKPMDIVGQNNGGEYLREVKIFRIIAEKYRNRRTRFALRFNLIAATYNLNLNTPMIFRRGTFPGSRMYHSTMNSTSINRGWFIQRCLFALPEMDGGIYNAAERGTAPPNLPAREA